MDIINLIKIIFLGIVEGITEWLPISSTGHMILVDELIKINMSSEFKEMFFVVIQLGAILAVVFLYFNKLNPFALKKSKEERMDTIILWTKVVVAVIPAGVVGLLFDDWFDEMFYNYQTVSFTLILYGVLFILIEKFMKKEPTVKTLKDLTFKAALLIGMFQVLAIIPGTSRSGATIIGGLLIGTSRVVVTEFTFFLAIPVMFGASLLKLVKFGLVFTGAEVMMLTVGTVVSFIVSIFAIKYLISYIKKHNFVAFGYYRIILGLIVILYSIFA
jgi:undecaprenyl-diphosphatase